MSSEGVFYDRCVCGKRGYGIRSLAESALERTAESNESLGISNDGLSVYECRRSGLFHIGHQRVLVNQKG